MTKSTSAKRRVNPNYKNDVMIKIIRAMEPASRKEWENVADEYKEKSGE